MSILKKSLLTSSLALVVGVSAQLPLNAAPVSTSNAQEGSLKLVMQGLLNDTQALTAAMVTENFVMIEKAAKNIAEHPTPSMATRMKLMKAMGTEMAKFKANDDIVHNASVNIVEHAQQKNIKGISDNFQVMVAGCIACHSEFKTKVSAILK